MNTTYTTDQIKNAVPLSRVIETYTSERFSKNKIKCPLHSEKTASFTIYPETNTFYCFGCGASGDAIKFVQLYHNINFKEAVQKIDNDFNLGLLSRPTLSEYRKRSAELQKRKAAQTIKNEQKAAADKKYWEALDRVREYENIIKRHCPGGPDAEPAPEFINALQNIEYARHLLDCAENERRRISEQ